MIYISISFILLEENLSSLTSILSGEQGFHMSILHRIIQRKLETMEGSNWFVEVLPSKLLFSKSLFGINTKTYVFQRTRKIINIKNNY